MISDTLKKKVVKNIKIKDMKTKGELIKGKHERNNYEILDKYVEVHTYYDNGEFVVEMITHDIVQEGMECVLKNRVKDELRTSDYEKAKKEFDNLCHSASIMEDHSGVLVAFKY